jgi:anti-sigma B factor antagonist
MQDGKFPVELVSGVPVVTAPQEIDVTNAPELRSALLQAAADATGTLVADMTLTRFCDSAGLHTLLAAHKRAQADGGELLLVIRSAAVLRILAITTIDRMIPNFTSLDQALAHTSPNGLNGRRRPDDELGGNATKIAGTAAQRGTADPADQHAE